MLADKAVLCGNELLSLHSLGSEGQSSANKCYIKLLKVQQ